MLRGAGSRERGARVLLPAPEQACQWAALRSGPACTWPSSEERNGNRADRGWSGGLPASCSPLATIRSASSAVRMPAAHAAANSPAPVPTTASGVTPALRHQAVSASCNASSADGSCCRFLPGASAASKPAAGSMYPWSARNPLSASLTHILACAGGFQVSVLVNDCCQSPTQDALKRGVDPLHSRCEAGKRLDQACPYDFHAAARLS